MPWSSKLLVPSRNGPSRSVIIEKLHKYNKRDLIQRTIGTVEYTLLAV
ncbi:MAG: hypothetical protein ACXV5R_00870 [Candidatus Angelobacter sp.]